MKASTFAYLFVGIFCTGLSINPAHAAPQALALVNSDGEVALQCHDGDCAATFSTYCLQKSRSMPSAGTAYEIANAGQVRLVGVRPDGSRVVLDASSELRLSSLRRQIAMRIALPKARLDALGLESATIEIGRNVTLLPKAVAGDANPLSEAEIALATGPLREVGTRVIESDPGKVGGARWILQLTDTLPRTVALTPKARRQFLDRARNAHARSNLSVAARDQAQDILNICQVKTELGAYDSLRQCFERRHDIQLWQVNVDYWIAIHHGS